MTLFFNKLKTQIKMKNLLLIAFGCLWLSPQLLFAQDTSETLKKKTIPSHDRGNFIFLLGQNIEQVSLKIRIEILIVLPEGSTLET